MKAHNTIHTKVEHPCLMEGEDHMIQYFDFTIFMLDKAMVNIYLFGLKPVFFNLN